MVRLCLWKSDTAAASQPHLFAVRQRAAHPWRVRADLPRLRCVITTAKVEVSVETEFWINCFSVCSFCRQKRRLVVKLFRLLTTDTVLWPRRQCSVQSEWDYNPWAGWDKKRVSHEVTGGWNHTVLQFERLNRRRPRPLAPRGFHHSRRNTGCRIDFNLKHKTEKDRYCAWEPPQPCAAQNGTH